MVIIFLFVCIYNIVHQLFMSEVFTDLESGVNNFNGIFCGLLMIN